MIKLLIGLLITFSVQASPRNLDLMSMYIEGCYLGKDSQGEAVSATIRYTPSNGDYYHHFHINGKRVDYLDLRFVQHDSGRAIATQIYEEGTYIDSRILNKLISYKFYGELERILDDVSVGKIKNETLLTVKMENQKFIFEVYQNNNKELIPDFYLGYIKPNSIKTFVMNKVNCR